MYMLFIQLVCVTVAFIPYVIYNCNKKKSKQPNEVSKKQQIKQTNEIQQQNISQKKKSLSMKKQKLVKKQVESEIKKLDDGKILNVASNIGIKKQISTNVAKTSQPIAAGETKKIPETREKIHTKKDKLLRKPKDGSIKVSESAKCKVEKAQKVIAQNMNEPLPEIKEGTMEIADSNDPKYKTLYIFMDKNLDVFGPDKWKPGQPEIGTMKKVSDEEFAATIEEIKARYGVIAKTDQETEINWDALFQAKNIENDGNVLIFTLPAEVLPKVKKKKKRKKKKKNHKEAN